MLRIPLSLLPSQLWYLVLLTLDAGLALGLAGEGKLPLAADPAETLEAAAHGRAGTALQTAAGHHLLVAAAVAEVI